ncbi:MAG: WD40/YVTN/BNR-like repeat-containing protein [Chloroflexota bacterium]|jgi:hypothetical protein
MTTLYVAMQDELLIISNRKGHWQTSHQLVGMNVQAVAVDPFRPEIAYSATYGSGVWRSEDAGVSWIPTRKGLAYQEVTAVAVSETERVGDRGVVWAGTEPSALFKSKDGGEHWEEKAGLRLLPSSRTWSYPPRPWTHHVRWIAPDAVVEGRIFVSIEAGGVMRSLDSGESWEDRRPDGPLDAHTIRSHKLAQDRLYAAAGDGLSAPGRGYAESKDGGCSWHRFGSGLKHHYLWGLAVNPRDPYTLLVSAARSPEAAHDPAYAESTVYMRTDESPWCEVQGGLPEPSGTLAAVLAAHDSEPAVFYLASNRGVYQSPDGGYNWEPLPIPWPDRFHRQRPHGLAVGG